jgi:hypothetical protein
MTNIIFDSRAWCLNIFPLMVEHLNREKLSQVNATGLYHNSMDFEKYSNNENDIDLNNYYKEGISKYSKGQLSELEKKYNLINLWHVVYFDRFLKDKHEEFIIQQISYYFFAWENIFNSYRPNFIVTETVTGLWNYVPFALAPYFNCKFLGYLSTKNTNKYFFTQDILGSFAQMNDLFNKCLQTDLTLKQKQQISEFLNKFNEKRMVPSYMKSAISLPKIHNFFNIYRISINVLKDIKTFWKVKNDYKIDYRISSYLRNAKRIFRVHYSYIFKLFNVPDYSENYILFPLHYQPEASTDIWAAYNSDQLSTVINIVKSIPINVTLYVKEHSAFLGSKEIAFYRKLKRLPNVKLIDPKVETNELIKNARAVVVLTSTAGLEGVILKKPVIILGSVFFDIYPNIFKVKSLKELPNLINLALCNFDPNENIYEKYIYAYINSGYEGRLDGTNFSKEETINHCNNLITEINYIGNINASNISSNRN